MDLFSRTVAKPVKTAICETVVNGAASEFRKFSSTAEVRTVGDSWLGCLDPGVDKNFLMNPDYLPLRHFGSSLIQRLGSIGYSTSRLAFGSAPPGGLRT
tara:strand:+ start:251 stop:547 length:297 start_codon:yes stop_codon:yes gene_type:complete